MTQSGSNFENPPILAALGTDAQKKGRSGAKEDIEKLRYRGDEFNLEVQQLVLSAESAVEGSQG